MTELESYIKTCNSIINKPCVCGECEDCREAMYNDELKASNDLYYKRC